MRSVLPQPAHSVVDAAAAAAVAFVARSQSRGVLPAVALDSRASHFCHPTWAFSLQLPGAARRGLPAAHSGAGCGRGGSGGPQLHIPHRPAACVSGKGRQHMWVHPALAAARPWLGSLDQGCAQLEAHGMPILSRLPCPLSSLSFVCRPCATPISLQAAAVRCERPVAAAGVGFDAGGQRAHARGTRSSGGGRWVLAVVCWVVLRAASVACC